MCGLVGFATSGFLGKNDKDAFSDLLYIDTLRGNHSTGIFSVNPINNNNTSILKRTLPGDVFISTKEYESFMSATGIKILSGHNRWATKGGVSYNNAHPFNHGPVTLMHNGTLRSQRKLEKSNGFGTDSEFIAYNMSLVEPGDVGNVISELHGAFALVWYDARDNSLNFCRNNERTLYMSSRDLNVESKSVGEIIWASEGWMVNGAIDHNNLKGFSEPDLMEPMYHYKLTLDTKAKPVFTWSVTSYKEYTAPAYKAGGSYYTGMYDTESSTDVITGNLSKKPEGGSTESGTNILPIKGNAGKKGGLRPPGYPKPSAVIQARPYVWENVGTSGKMVSKYKLNDKEINCIVFGIQFEEFRLLRAKGAVKLNVLGYSWNANSGEYSCHCELNVSERIGLLQEASKESKVETTQEKKSSTSLFTEEGIINLPALIGTPSSMDDPSGDGSYIDAMDGELIPFEDYHNEKEGNIQDDDWAKLDSEDYAFLNGPDGHLLSWAEYYHLTKRGCIWCKRQLTVKDSEGIIWCADDTPMCSECGEEIKNNQTSTTTKHKH